MKILVVLAVCMMAAVHTVPMYKLVQEQWMEFKVQYDKNYASLVEEEFRMKIFMQNSYQIAHHNQLYKQGLVSYKLKMNKWGDKLHFEFVEALNGFNRTSRKNAADFETETGATFIPPANVQLPPSIDWRKKGAVTPVKDQGECGSCWSFSATGALEGQHFRRNGTLISLSEQNLIDCSTKYGNQGCLGGLMDYAFRYIRDNRGIDTEVSYPYEAEDDPCRYNSKNSGASDVGYTDIKSGSENDLQAAVASVGPISVAIDASHDSFQFYSKGIYYEPRCSSQDLDHGVLAVGYGVDSKNEEYWIVKNSWGKSWGDEGYILMSRNRHNNCGIATMASYPLV